MTWSLPEDGWAVGGGGAEGGSDGRHSVRNGGGHQGRTNNGGRQGDGLNPNRQRGFGPPRRIETPTLNDMRARQGL